MSIKNSSFSYWHPP